MDMDMLRSMVEQESDGHMKTVTFNYPKYEAEGTPHEVWLFNVGKVEKSLEDIVEGAPWREEYPLIHLRREEADDNGRIIRVHLDLFGRRTMVELALVMLQESEKVYVMANRLATPEGRQKIQSMIAEDMPPELKEKLSNLGMSLDNLKTMPAVGDPNDPAAAAIEPVKALFRAQGYDVPDDSLTKIPEGSDYDGSLDLAFEGEGKGDLPFYLMPNPDPNEVH